MMAAAGMAGVAMQRGAVSRFVPTLVVTAQAAQQPIGLAGAHIGLAQHVILVGQYAIVVGGPAQQHGAGGHQAALGAFDDLQMAGPAGLARRPIVRWVDEADELRRLLVEQCVAALRVGGGREMPRAGIARQHMRIVPQAGIGGINGRQRRRGQDLRVPTMAIGAAEHDRGRRVHRRRVAGAVAGDAAGRLGIGLVLRLPFRRRRGTHPGIITRNRLFAFRGDRHAHQGDKEDEGETRPHVSRPALR